MSFCDSRRPQFLLKVMFSRKIKCFPLETVVIYLKDKFPPPLFFPAFIHLE